jgi:hypothetical protein
MDNSLFLFLLDVGVIRMIRRAEMISAWYGIAWPCYRSDSVYCMPVPLNVLVAIVRGIWLWMAFGYRPVPWGAHEAYRQGYLDGRGSVSKSDGDCNE